MDALLSHYIAISSHKIDPTESMASSLVVGVQQPFIKTDGNSDSAPMKLADDPIKPASERPHSTATISEESTTPHEKDTGKRPRQCRVEDFTYDGADDLNNIRYDVHTLKYQI